ncbi:MAG: hypothetical protein ACTSUN_11125 [Promethearchaeota archaeon]
MDGKCYLRLTCSLPRATDRIGRVACELCLKRLEEGIGKGLLEIV